MKLLAYPEYRNSEAEWLGRVPAHWAVKRLRSVTRSIEQGWSPQCDNQLADDDAWGVMKVGCVNGDKFDALENKALPPEIEPKPEYELRPRDILVSRANTKELLGSAAIVPDAVRPRLLLCDKLFRLRPEDEVHEGFLTLYLRTSTARCHYEREATGASASMQNIGQHTLKGVAIPLPTRDEQRQIAAFLDWKTTQINALIAKKQALIEKLKEKRLAEVTQAVTKGLDPAAPSRESGVSWLGDIPEDWEVIPLGFLMTMSGGLTPSMANADYWQGEIPWSRRRT